MAYDCIADMKGAPLLVPLPSLEEDLDRWERYGYVNKARRIRKRWAKRNGKIMEAFRENYAFGPVYFYFYPDERAIFSQGQTGLFVDKDLKRNSSIRPDLTRFYVAEFEETVEYQGENEEEVMAIVLKDAQFRMLPNPLPAVEQVHGFPSGGSISRAVRQMNRDLERFWERRERFVTRN